MRKLILSVFVAFCIAPAAYCAEDVRAKLRVESTAGPFSAPVNLLKFDAAAVTANGDGSVTVAPGVSVGGTNTWSGPQTFSSSATFSDDDLSVNGSDLFLDGGLAGLGTSAPSADLHVYNSASHATVRVENELASGSDSLVTLVSGSRARLTLDGDADGNSNEVDIQFRRNGTLMSTLGWNDVIDSATKALHFAAGGTINASPDMTLRTNSLGIGTVAPEERLHVSGGNIAVDNNTDYRAKDTGGSPRQVLSMDASNVVVVGDVAAGYDLRMSAGVSTVTWTAGGRMGIKNGSPSHMFTLGSGASTTTANVSVYSHTISTGAQTGTLTNSPTAGNPAGYLKVQINGTDSYLPFWQ